MSELNTGQLKAQNNRIYSKAAAFPRETREQYRLWQCSRANAATGNLNEDDGYDCPICLNKGYISVIAGEEIVMRPCKCMRIRKTLLRAKDSGLGETIMQHKFSNFLTPEQWQQNIKDLAIAFCADNDATCFYIGGNSGSGKTHICTAICASLIKRGVDTKYMLWRDDITKIKSTMGDSSEYRKAMAEYKDPQCLYIDDFLKTLNPKPTPAELNIAFELLNYRMLDRSKKTIISSEYIITDAMKFDEATMSRIYKAAGIYKISIAKDISKNYRLKGE